MDINKLINDVRELAEKYPNNVYSGIPTSIGCYYDKGDNSSCEEKGCIFGIAALKQSVVLTNNGPISSKSQFLDNIPTMEQILWCSKVQNLQDRQEKWSYAVKVADEECPL